MFLPNNISNFAKNFKRILEEKGVSQSEFARKLNVKQNTVNQWVNGKREPNLDNLIKICFTLEVSPSEILGYDHACERIVKLNEMIEKGENIHFEKYGVGDIIFEMIEDAIDGAQELIEKINPFKK